MYSESLNSDWVIEHAMPYLGKFISGPTPYSPASTQFVDNAIEKWRR